MASRPVDDAAAAPVVIVSMAGQLSALHAPSFAVLNESVKRAYGSLVTDSEQELVMTYVWRGVRLDVRSEHTLATYLKLHTRGELATPKRPVSAGGNAAASSLSAPDGALPVLELIRRNRIAAVPFADELDSDGAAAGHLSHADAPIVHGSSSGASTAMTASGRQLPDTQAKPTSQNPGTHPAAAAGGAASVPRALSVSGIYEDIAPSPPESPPRETARTDRPNSATARALLESFQHYSTSGEHDTDGANDATGIRMLMRDGSASVIMPYDPASPPPLSDMRRFAWEHFAKPLEDGVAALRATDEGKEAERRLKRPIQAKDFLLGFWFDGCELPVDMEDAQDEVLLKCAVAKVGLDDVFLYVDIPFVELSPVKEDIIMKRVPAVSPRGLQVNLTRLPVRDSVRLAVKQQLTQLALLRERIKADKEAASRLK